MTPHPSDADLRGFALGELDDAKAAAVAAHLPGCADCTAKLDQVTRDDFAGRVADVASRPAAGEPAAGTVLGGRYELVEPLGEGGMGSVWLARQADPKRLVAVKLVRADRDTARVLARFDAERQALAVMDHPNIAKVFDAGTTPDGRPSFVMELVKGVPITRYCDDHTLTPRERLGLFVPVCQAVQHAHQKGVIHRDIKPSNVLVAEYDGVPVPKVIDFGLAKATEASPTAASLETEFGTVLGTPEYMSPEQATLNPLDVDTRTDVYALGVLLYELLTGSTPFTRKELTRAGVVEILRVIQEDEPPRPSARLSSDESLPSVAAYRRTDPARLPREVRGELDWIVLKALDKKRDRRYESPAGLAADVLRHLGGEPVSAAPPSRWYRARKFARRHRGRLAAGAAFAGVVIGAGVWIGLTQLEAERRQTKVEREKLTESLVAAARLALERGDVKRMLAVLAEAEANGLVPTPELRLDRARGYRTLGYDDEARRELDAVDAADPAPETRAATLIVQADFALFTDAGTSLDLMRRAEAAGPLSAADRAYIRGVRSESCPAALAAFREAIGHDPRHVPARELATLTAFLLGRLDEFEALATEMRLLYPDHPSATLFAAMAAARRGDVGAVDRAVAGMAAKGSPVALLARAFAILVTAREDPPHVLMGKITALLDSLNAGPHARGEVSPTLRPNDLPPFVRPLTTYLTDRFAFVLTRDPFERLKAALLPTTTRLGFDKPGAIERAAALLKLHPEGACRFIYANALWDRIPASPPGRTPTDAGRSEQYRRAAVAHREAYRTPMLIDFRVWAIDGAILCYAMAALSAAPDLAPDLFVRAADIVAERVRLFGTPPADRFSGFVAAARLGGRVQLARQLLHDAYGPAGFDSKGWLLRAEVEHAGGAYSSARDAARHALASDGLNPRERERAADVLAASERMLAGAVIRETAPPPRSASAKP